MLNNYIITLLALCFCTLNAYTQCAIIEISVTNVSCNAYADGEIVLDHPTSCISPTTYSWSHGASGPIASGLSAGFYEVTLTDGAGNQDTKNWLITEPTAIDISVTGDAPFCAGGSDGLLIANASGGTPGYTYYWSNGVTTSNNYNLAAGIYTVTATDSNGCSAEKTVAVSDPEPVEVVTTTYNNISCSGANDGHIAVMGQGGDDSYYTYMWSNGSSDAELTNLSPGVYTVTVSDFNICTATETFSIFDPTDIIVTFPIVNDLTCYEDGSGSIEINAAGGTGALSYAWSNGATTNVINNLQAGDYSLTITDANGCIYTDTYTVNQPNEIQEIEPALVDNVSCNGLSDGQIEVYITGGTGTLVYSWSNGASGINPENLSAGTYTLTVTDASSCTFVKTYIVDEPNPISVTFPILNHVSCAGYNDGSIEINPSGGTPAYSYSWSNGATTNVISNLIAGTYNLTISDANNCQLVQSYTINEPADIVITSPIIQDASCNGAQDGSIEINPTGGTPGYSYSWSNVSTDTNINEGLSAGFYSVIVTDANGCTLAQSFTVTEPDALEIVLEDLNNVTCNADSDGSINVSAIGGTPGYTYSWSNGSNNPIQQNLNAGVYTVTVTDANNCTAVATYEITEPAVLVSNATVTDEMCSGDESGSIVLNPSGGTAPYSYNWSNAQSGSSINNLAADNYQVTITDANGCSLEESFVVSYIGFFTVVSQTGTAITCHGANDGTITIEAIGATPVSYLWPDGTTGPTVGGLEAGVGSLDVVLSDENGCESIATISFDMYEPDELVLTVEELNAVSCNAGSDGSITVSAQGGTPDYSYQWSNGASGASLQNITAGNYTVTLTDTNGCTLEQLITVEEPAQLIIIEEEISSVSCNGGVDGAITVSAQGGTPSYSFFWSDGSNGATLQNVAAGDYTVTVSDAQGCTSSSSIAVTEPSALQSNSAITFVTCPMGTDGSISLTPSGGMPGYTYLWSTGATTNAIENLTAGIYSATITDANGCTLEETYNVSEPQQFTITNESQSNITCAGADNGSLSVTMTGGTGLLSYTWSNGATGNSIADLAPGEYSVIVTDELGCSAQSDIYEITSPSAINIETVNLTNNLCAGDALGLIEVLAQGGTGALTYTWSNGANTALINGLSDGEYSLTVTDENNCIATASYQISSPDAIAISSEEINNLTCYESNDGSISIAVSGGTGSLNYAWSNGATTAAINDLAAGSYTVTITDENACYIEKNYSITQPTEIILEAEITPTECGSSNTGAISVVASGGAGGYQYLWSTGATVASIVDLASGNYSLTVTDQEGCTTEAEYFVSQPGDIEINNTQIEDNICPNGTSGSISIDAQGGVGSLSYLWSTGSENNSINNLSNGTYSVTITDENACNLSQSFEVSSPEAISVNDLILTDATCFGSNDGAMSFSIDGGIAPYVIEFVFTPIQSTEVISIIEENVSESIAQNFSAGEVKVKITDSNNCIFEMETVNISQPEILSTSTIEVIQPTCFGGDNGEVKFEIDGGVSPYEVKVTYTPLTGEVIEETLTVSQEFNYAVAAGSISLEVVDANACVLGLPMMSIGQPAQMVITDPVIVPASCHGDTTGMVTFSIDGGTSPYSVEWTYLPNNGEEQFIEFVFSETNEISRNFGAGTVHVKVLDANDCELLIPNITIAEAEAIEIKDIEIMDAFCSTDTSGIVSFFISGGASPYSVEWQYTPNDGGAPIVKWSENVSEMAMENFAPGKVTAKIVDANNCTIEVADLEIKESYNVAVNLLEVIPPTCGKDSSGMVSLVAFDGASPYAVEWTYTPVGGTEIFVEWTYNVTDTVAFNFGAGTVSIHVEDANGCSFDIDQFVLENIDGVQLEEIKVSYTDSLGSIELITDIDPTMLNFVWTGPNGFTADSYIIEELEDGLYSCIIKDANGCQITTGDIEIVNIVSTNEIDYSDILKVNTLVHDDLYIDYLDTEKAIGYLMSMNGEVLTQFDIQKGDQVLSMENWPDAMYVLQVIVGTNSYAIPLAKF